MTEAMALPRERTAKDWKFSPVTSHHHLSFRCRDAEETRQYYEDFLGLEFTAAIPTTMEIDGRQVQALNMMFRMQGGDFITFYDVRDGGEFDLPDLGPLDRHLAFKVPSKEAWDVWVQRLTDAGVKFEGPLDHDFVRSVYWPDPNGVWLEFAYEVQEHEDIIAALELEARKGMADWTVMTSDIKQAGGK